MEWGLCGVGAAELWVARCSVCEGFGFYWAFVRVRWVRCGEDYIAYCYIFEGRCE